MSGLSVNSVIMIVQPNRVPGPIRVGEVDKHTLADLGYYIPLDRRTEISHPAGKLLNDFPDDFPPGFYEKLRPMSAVAIEHHEQEVGIPPDRARVVITNIGERQGSANKWHRDSLMPGESLYFAVSETPPEFVEGDGILGVNFVPNMALNGLTNRLLDKGQLHAVTVEPGDIVNFGGGAIHRRPPDLPTEGRISIALHLSYGYADLSRIVTPIP